MTDTEKILNLLEINEAIPSLVTEDDGVIISGNNIFIENFKLFERGHNFYSLFDKNTSLLIKNSFIDAKIFLKIQRRDVQIKIDSEIVDLKLIISPFKLDAKIYFFILLFNDDYNEEVLIYPSLDENGITIKYKNIINSVKGSIPKTLIEKKNLQYSLDVEKESIALKDRVQFLFTNNSFREGYSLRNNSKNIITVDDILPEKLSAKIKIAENELYNTFSQFVLEKKGYFNLTQQLFARVILFPIFNKEGLIEATIIVGKINLESNSLIDKSENNVEKQNLNNDLGEKKVINNSEDAQIIYDKNNFDILDANMPASEMYGYEIEELKRMNITKLFVPEDMQKLIMPPQENGKFIFNHLTKSGNVIEVNVERGTIVWNEKDAYCETITLNQLEEEIIELEEYAEDVKNEPKSILPQPTESKTEAISDFLSTMFHELLTPVNVILGFVQEIIDSVDNPTDEQEESAQIIKDNQTILLHTMNTAVQYAQLHENRIPLNIEEFDLNNYLVDLQDSFSRVSDKENTTVIFGEIPEPLKLEHDRTKLLAVISYFIKFVIKLTKTSKVFVSFNIINDHVYLLVKDSENGISENIFTELFELFNSNKINDRKNYGISSITIRLAKQLKEMLNCKVEEFTDENNIKSIALIMPSLFENSFKIKDEEIEDSSKVEEQIIEEKVDSVKHNLADDEVIEKESKQFISVNHSEIANGDVDEKIVEDIQEEEEIVTEEIATVHEVSSETSSIAGLSCLFIDDNLDTQLLFKSQMKDFKHLKVCSNLTQALPFLSKYNFDIVIVDVNLNDTYNGLDALKIIRQFSNYVSIPIIAVTAYSFDGDREKFINFGFTDYFVKPLLREQLLKSLEVII